MKSQIKNANVFDDFSFWEKRNGPEEMNQMLFEPHCRVRAE